MILGVFSGAIGLAMGLLCGAALCAIIRVLGIFQRLRKRLQSTVRLELCAMAGMLFGTCLHLEWLTLNLPVFIAAVMGLGSGIYLGMMTASLAEITSILPIIAQKIKVPLVARAAAIAWLIGKVAGSLLYWVNPLWRQ